MCLATEATNALLTCSAQYEQLKKQQKGKKGGAKKKDDAAADDSQDTKDEAITEDSAVPDTTDAAGEAKDTAETDALPAAQSSTISQQSKERSQSFRRGSIVSGDVRSPGPSPLDHEGGAQEIYKKQAARIEELEKERAGLASARDESATKLSKAEEELETLREGSGELAGLKSKASLADERAKEVERLVRAVRSTGLTSC